MSNRQGVPHDFQPPFLPLGQFLSDRKHNTVPIARDIMAIPSTKFRLTLLNVGEYLTENDVQNLAFLCDDIKPARRETLRTARELFVELQGRDLLNENNVSILSGWLEELNLWDALRPLQEDSGKFLQGTAESQERCFEHEDLVLKYFCVSCDSKVCADCAFNLHDKSSHDVINLCDVNTETQKRRRELQNEVAAMRKKSEGINENWKEKKEFFSKCRERMRREIQSDTILIHENAEKNKISLFKQLDEREISNFEVLMKEKEEIEHVMNRVAHLEKEMHDKSSDTFSDLRRLTKAKCKLEEINDCLKQQEIEVKKKVVELQYKKLPCDGACGILVSCSLVGGIVAHPKQLIHVFDERQGSGGFSLICVDPSDTSKKYWRHLVTHPYRLFPVVMSYIELYYNDKMHFVFAVGRTIFNVLLHWSGTMFDSVESVSSLVLNGLDNKSWITFITGSLKPGSKNDTFVISVNNSSILREYHVSGVGLRKIDTRDITSSITAFAYTDNIFAIVSSANDNVTLITANNTLKHSGSLVPTQTSSCCLFPSRVIWDGAYWLVLFLSDGKEKEWNVVKYQKTGEPMGVCCEGSSCSDLDVPVGVSRLTNTGFVSFADSTIKIFRH